MMRRGGTNEASRAGMAAAAMVASIPTAAPLTTLPVEAVIPRTVTTK